MITRGHKHHPKGIQVLTQANLLVLWKHETFRNEMFANWLLPESYFLVTALTCTTGILRLCAPAANYVVSFFLPLPPQMIRLLQQYSHRGTTTLPRAEIKEEQPPYISILELIPTHSL